MIIFFPWFFPVPVQISGQVLCCLWIHGRLNKDRVSQYPLLWILFHNHCFISLSSFFSLDWFIEIDFIDELLFPPSDWLWIPCERDADWYSSVNTQSPFWCSQCSICCVSHFFYLCSHCCGSFQWFFWCEFLPVVETDLIISCCCNRCNHQPVFSLSLMRIARVGYGYRKPTVRNCWSILVLAFSFIRCLSSKFVTWLKINRC